MEFIIKKLNQLFPYENNPRLNDKAVDAVANSIKEFGFKVPIVIDTNHVIVTGHTRYKAAEQLGLESIPCIIADDLTPEQIQAFRLADNKTGELAEWDYDMLNQEIEQLNIDMSQFGFDKLQESMQEELENTIQELSPDEYSDNNFACECPRCGFRFNKE